MENSRNTRQKQLILTILKETDRPMSINEVYQQVANVMPKIAKSTIYRNVDALLEQKLIDKYHFNDNEIFYRIKADSNEHKHFIICDECKKVFDLPSCPIHEIEHSIEKEGFVIKDHLIQITGTCKECTKENTK